MAQTINDCLIKLLNRAKSVGIFEMDRPLLSSFVFPFYIGLSVTVFLLSMCTHLYVEKCLVCLCVLCTCLHDICIVVNQSEYRKHISRIHCCFWFQQRNTFVWLKGVLKTWKARHKKCNSFKRKLFEIRKITLACLFVWVFVVVSLLLYSFIAFDWTEKKALNYDRYATAFVMDKQSQQRKKSINDIHEKT